MRCRALILDFDGLILETEGACFAAWRALFREHGADYPLAEYQRILGSDDSAHALFEQRCGRPADWAALDRRRRAIEDELHLQLAPQPGVVALLDQSDALGFRAAIASSSPHRWVDGHLAKHGLTARFVTTVCRDDVARAKPAPDLYLEALRRLGVAANEALAIEDSHHGSRAAKAAGLRCVAVPTLMTHGQDFSHVDLVLPTLEGVDLAALFQRLDDSSR